MVSRKHIGKMIALVGISIIVIVAGLYADEIIKR